jgi:hypothetical protein
MVNKLLKNHIPRRKITTLLFFLKLEVFRPNIIAPNGPYKE